MYFEYKIFHNFENVFFNFLNRCILLIIIGILKKNVEFLKFFGIWLPPIQRYFVNAYWSTVDQLVDQYLEWLTLMAHKMKQNFWIERLYFEKELFTEILYRGARICLWHIDTIVTLLWHHILAIALSLHWVRSRIEVLYSSTVLYH